MRRTRLYVCAALLVVAVALAWLLWPASDPVRDAYDTIEPGWTRAEVERVMGTPSEMRTSYFDPKVILEYEYHGTGGVAFFVFDSKSEVTHKTWYEPERDTLWLRFRKWLKPPTPPTELAR